VSCAQATPRTTHTYGGSFKTKADARQALRFIKSSCKSFYLGRDCLEVLNGSDSHYYNIVKQN